VDAEGAGHVFEILWLCPLVPFLYYGGAGWNGMDNHQGLQIEPREFRFTHHHHDRSADRFDATDWLAFGADWLVFKNETLNPKM
jgi:hypothetical protein